MSICTTCFQADPIPTCAGTLVIGTIDPDLGLTDVNVYFQYSPTGNIQMFPGVVDSEGLVTVEDAVIATGGYVKIWVNDPATDNFNIPIPVTIDNIEYECIEAKIIRLRGLETVIHNLTIVEA
jgi:hypothetical protein